MILLKNKIKLWFRYVLRLKFKYKLEGYVAVVWIDAKVDG